MLAAEKNHELTQVGAGTPMGEYLRRYWHPIAGASELSSNPVKPIRLMGEDLVLYKDLSGNYGLIDRQCPHRDRKSTRLNSSHIPLSRMPSSA